MCTPDSGCGVGETFFVELVDGSWYERSSQHVAGLMGRIDGRYGSADIRWPRVNNQTELYIMILIQYSSDPTNSGQICITVALADVQWLPRFVVPGLARRVVAVSVVFPAYMEPGSRLQATHPVQLLGLAALIQPHASKMRVIDRPLCMTWLYAYMLPIPVYHVWLTLWVFPCD